MNKRTLTSIFSVWAAFAVLTIVGLVKADDFVLRGEGRNADLTSMEKSVAPDKDLKIIITGNHPYRSESKGRFSLYKAKRQKIKEIRFALQPGETKSWEFPTEEKVQHIGFGVYGKGEIRVVLQQGAQGASQAITGAESVIAEQAQSKSAAAVQSSESASGSFPLLLKEAERSYLGGNKLEAVEKLTEAILDIWNEVPLTVKNVRIVEDTETYVTRENNVFGSGEKMHFSTQLFGYKMKRLGGAYSINITTDVYFLREGEILAGQQDFGKFELITPLPNTSFRLDLTYWLTGAPAGVYDVQTVVHDQNSGQSTKFTTQIEMR